MKSKIILAFLLSYTSLSAQDTAKIVAKFRIVESIHNGRLLSAFEQERKGVIYIHYNKENILELSNISLKNASYSTGRLTNKMTDSVFSSNYKLVKIKSQYNWKYFNSYNNKKGSAIITLIEESTNYGNAFQLIMILGKNNKIIYKGFKIDETSQYVIPKTIF